MLETSDPMVAPMDRLSVAVATPRTRPAGLVAARRIRERYPETAVVLLSQYLEPRYAQRLLADQPGGLGYLLKERVSDIAVLIDALTGSPRVNASSTPPSCPG
jgi:DNA-binding NarL/FixJ family response regulator